MDAELVSDVRFHTIPENMNTISLAYLSEQYVRIAILPFLELTHCSCVVSKPVTTTQGFFDTRC